MPADQEIFGPPTQFTAAGGAIVGSNASALPFMRPGVPTATLEQPTVDIVDVRDGENENDP